MSKYTAALINVNDTWSRLKDALDKNGSLNADIPALIKEHDDALKELKATSEEMPALITELEEVLAKLKAILCDGGNSVAKPCSTKTPGMGRTS